MRCSQNNHLFFTRFRALDQPSEPPASKIMKQPEVNGAETASTSGSGPSPSDTKTIAVVKPSNFLTSVTSVTSMSTASMRSNVASGNHNNKHETAVSDNNNDKLQINTPCEKQTQNDDIGEDLTTKSKSEAAATSTEESCEVKLTTGRKIFCNHLIKWYLYLKPIPKLSIDLFENIEN